ncbi:hypothetical protein BZG36_02535 [Bifiguratus adelaidae]|uniref:ferric-chelate reductase (NADPH) n=1 Tax=Bifiguratus adelaidae TaxID=1938954 RepID=A0A261Y243_9FUNG|nr:hypothetical protein BZG36_02535 [Bifiguratus adelaidae]
MNPSMDMSTVDLTDPNIPYTNYYIAFMSAGIGAVVMYRIVWLLARPRPAVYIDKSSRPSRFYKTARSWMTLLKDRLSPACSTVIRKTAYVRNKLLYTPHYKSWSLWAIGDFLILAALIAVLATLLVLNADLLLNSNRAGFMGLTTIPFLFAFAGKNSLVSFLTGISHEKIIKIHRWLGRILLLFATVHMSIWINQWAQFPWFLQSQLATDKVRYGLTTYTALCIINFFSLPPFRKYTYEVFLVTHGMFLVFLIMVGMHTPYAMRFTASGIILYICNLSFGWFVRTHYARARFTALEDRCTQITLTYRSIQHDQRKPGQHIYLCIPKISLIEWHPFTISNIDQDTITCHVRSVGGYTNKLYDLGHGVECVALVAGPYGKPPEMKALDPKVRTIVLMAGGVGASYTVPILEDLVYNSEEVDSDTTSTAKRRVIFIWAIKNEAQRSWFQPAIEACLASSSSHNISLSIEIYISPILETSDTICDTLEQARCAGNLTANNDTPLLPAEKESSQLLDRDPRCKCNPCRCCVDDLVKSCCQSGKAENDVEQSTEQVLEDTGGDISVIACGPTRLLTDVKNTVASCTNLRGAPHIELHCESFEY